MAHLLRACGSRQQLLRRLLKLSSESARLERPVSFLVSLHPCSTFSTCGSHQAGAAGWQLRGFASQPEQSFKSAVPGVSAVPQNTSAVSEVQPDIISKALAKGPAEIPLAAKAYYLGSKIDIAGLRDRAHRENFPTHSHKNDSTLVCLRKGSSVSDTEHVTGLPLETYMAAFSYGSVIIFNAQSDLLVKALLNMVLDFTVQKRNTDYVEELMIRVRPDMETWSVHSPEHITLKQLDWSNLRVISAVLGQSVALDFYAKNVERMLDAFVDMNLEMQKTGNLSASISKEELLKLVAQNNLILTDLLIKIGLLEYYDVAWKTSQYGRIWEYLRREYDVESRFETIEDKLKLVQENLKYVLELRQHQKSDFLEWTIIVLIGAEIFLSLEEMFGLGSKVVRKVSALIAS